MAVPHLVVRPKHILGRPAHAGLAIGRAQEMLGQNRPPEEVAIIHPQMTTLISFVLLVVGMILLKRLSPSRDEVSVD